MFTQTGYSYYTGGFVDSGGWYVDKLEALSIDELESFLANIVFEKNRPIPELSEEDKQLQKTWYTSEGITINGLQMKHLKHFLDEEEIALMWGK